MKKIVSITDNILDLDIDKITIPENHIPVTIEFDKDRIIGWAKLFKKDNEIKAEIEFRKDINLEIFNKKFKSACFTYATKGAKSASISEITDIALFRNL